MFRFSGVWCQDRRFYSSPGAVAQCSEQAPHSLVLRKTGCSYENADISRVPRHRNAGRKDFFFSNRQLKGKASSRGSQGLYARG